MVACLLLILAGECYSSSRPKLLVPLLCISVYEPSLRARQFLVRLHFERPFVCWHRFGRSWDLYIRACIHGAGSCGSTKFWEGAVSPSSALRNSHLERMNSMPLKASLMFVGPHLRGSSRVLHPFLHWYSTKPCFLGASDYQRQSFARAVGLRMTFAADSGSGNPDMMSLVIAAKDQTISMLISSHREAIAANDQAIDQVIAKADQAIAAKDQAIDQVIAAKDQAIDQVIAKADQAMAAKDQAIDQVITKADQAIAKADETIAAKDEVIAAKKEEIAAKELAHFTDKKEMARELVKHMAILDD